MATRHRTRTDRPRCHKTSIMTPPRRESYGFAPVIESDVEETGQGSHGETIPENPAATNSENNKNKQTNPETPGPKSASGPNDDGFNAPNDGENRYRLFSVGNQNYRTSGKVKKDGRLRITVNETANTGYLAKALGAALTKVAPPVEQTHTSVPDITVTDEDAPTIGPRPRLNIVIMVIGSRGDAQPFLKIGKVLKEQYGHRVRIATHPAFREFVEKDSGLEFFSVGGDPAELMAFMVKSPGLIPTLDSVMAGDIGRRRAAMAEMFDGFWRACINATDDEKDRRNLKMMGEKDPFVADTIIANPPSFAHIHCAEALGIPLHLMFTFPYTPTQAFPHPLASIKKSNVDPGYTNFISYPLVEMMVWQGLGDLVNDFRVKTLCLDPMSTLWAPGATYRLHVPFSYLWSPELVPKPEDWGNEIDISGFVFLDLASTFEPPKELEDFLNAGEPPVYIGFGSIVVDDPDRFTNMIFEAVKMAGVRALVSKGWGGLGGDEVPDNVFMLDNTPHDWLFPRVKACVIHGGAGTTAIALKCGKPTMVVPFFGDQHFWGQMLGSAGVGPDPVPYKGLDAEKLAEGIKYCLTNEAQVAADKMAQSIDNDGDGAENAVEQFHRQLELRGPTTMRCSIFKDQTAVWKLKDSHVRLSAVAADALVGKGLLSWKRLRLIRHVEWNDFEGPGEPVTGVAGSIAKTFGEAFTGIASVPYRMVKRSKQHKQRKNKAESTKKWKKSKQQEGPGTLDRSGSETSQKTIDAESISRSRTEPYVGDVARGVERTAVAIAKAPADLSLALAQGFHNAPRLYGDDTVRRPPRVTGIRSGLRAARFELVYGVYDGFTGVFRLPVRGAKNDGVLGFVKGVGMGLTGLVLKNLAAIVGPFGYTLKGVVKQAERSKRPDKFIRRARIEQGRRDFKELPEQRRREVTQQATEGWLVMKDLCDILGNMEGQNGLAAKIDRVLLNTDSLFEAVDTARKALEQLRRGETLENVLNQDERGRANGTDEICDVFDNGFVHRKEKASSVLSNIIVDGPDRDHGVGLDVGHGPCLSLCPDGGRGHDVHADRAPSRVHALACSYSHVDDSPCVCPPRDDTR
ncbi:hypothetical protein B0T10DRAFT_528756 [Thelonectria olida]|uniref:Glycosyltransferase family 28 N-terminal domain-containing protein n=1 Tax=Thelonectria olida TaxID=1576542 RepID=A0A9P8W8V9_9HYPO|nr:hypothetical protein B0T10DRAFT_528756 [Thelonectria olida]